MNMKNFLILPPLNRIKKLDSENRSKYVHESDFINATSCDESEHKNQKYYIMEIQEIGIMLKTVILPV